MSKLIWSSRAWTILEVGDGFVKDRDGLLGSKGVAGPYVYRDEVTAKGCCADGECVRPCRVTVEAEEKP